MIGPKPDISTGMFEGSSIRNLERIVLHEISLVTFPANPKARIAEAKSALAAGHVPSKADCERLLHDSGFSRKQAAALVARGYSGLSPEVAEAEALAEAIRRATAILR
jgi:hypothetical protein